MRNYANEVDAFDCAVPEAWWRAATLEAVLSALYTFISGLAYVEIAGGNGFGSGVSGLAMAGLIYVGLEISGGQMYVNVFFFPYPLSPPPLPSPILFPLISHLSSYLLYLFYPILYLVSRNTQFNLCSNS